MTINSLTSTAVVVVGGGFGGLTTALCLSSCKERPAIVLIEPRPRFVFLPLLYELLSGELQAWEVSQDYRTLLAAKGIILIDQAAEKLDLEKKLICTSSGQRISFSELVISTGSKSDTFGIPGVREHSLMFNQYEDVYHLRNLISKLNSSQKRDQNLVIVGAGASGVELACKIADLLDSKISIHLIELNERVLFNGKSFNQEQIEQALIEKSIKLHLNTRVLRINATNLELINVVDHPERKFSLDHAGVIWTAGTRPSIPQGLPQTSVKDGRVLIDSKLEVIGCKNVFAIGDIAFNVNNPIPATAQAALQQGEHLAKNLIFRRSLKSLINFEFVDRGEMLSMGIGKATITGMGLTIAGSIAFQIRRMTYLSKFPNRSLRIRSAGAWLLSYGKKFI